MSGGVVGAARRRFGDRPASLLLATPIVFVIAVLDAALAGLSAVHGTFVADFTELRSRRKELRATPQQDDIQGQVGGGDRS